MIQVYHQKPGLNMGQQIQPVHGFPRTRQAAKIVAQVDQLIEYFTRVRGHRPDVVHLRDTQMSVLRIRPGYRYKGVTLEVAR